MTSGQEKVVAGTLTALLAAITIISYQTQQATDRIAKGADKLESAAKILQESDDCVSRCPSYKTGEYTGTNYKAPDNSDHEKCTNTCNGEQRQKFKTLLAK